MTKYNAVPLSQFELSDTDINTIKESYPEFENIFDTNNTFAIPLKLIEEGLENEGVNTDLLLNIYQTKNIHPTTLFEYCATIFKHASKHNQTKQKEIIATIDSQYNNKTQQEIKKELSQLEQHIQTTFFEFLKNNYQQKANELSTKLQYNTDKTPQKDDVWEINLLNIQGTKQTNQNKPITVAIEDFIIPKENNNTFFDSPALVRVVGEYTEYNGIEEGNIFIATPNAFSNGQYITNLNET